MWTAPNVLSMVRLAGVGVFLWVLLVPRADLLAVAVLAAAGVTDWLDGWLARRLGQVTRLGQLLDPIADRLYILAIVVGLAARGVIPWWLVAILIARDVMLVLVVPLLGGRGYRPLPVHFLGKAATFCLLYAFPLVLLGSGEVPIVPDGWAVAARIVGWAFALWGTGLYWWAGLLYVAQARMLLRERTD
ncbi:CDP-alcohol phosphatidyltransferase family protein [Naumannella cuiyingiana]|uniref:CDP-alcohol phosphatidyltransferase family protein n=1 Tax=Naumannella cuiyingiana TaxID=1347891 RepID=UPI0031B584DA